MKETILIICWVVYGTYAAYRTKDEMDIINTRIFIVVGAPIVFIYRALCGLTKTYRIY